MPPMFTKSLAESLQKKSKLLENIALRILDALYSDMKNIKRATVKIKKMNPPVGSKVGSVSVIMTR